AEIVGEIEATVGDIANGPIRLALNTYFGILAAMKRSDIARVAAVEAKHPAVRTVALKFFIAKVLNDFKKFPQLLHGANANIAAYAWQGAIFNVLEAVVMEDLAAEPDLLGRFLARWNLQALGYSSRTIKKAMLEIDKLLAIRHKVGLRRKHDS